MRKPRPMVRLLVVVITIATIAASIRAYLKRLSPYEQSLVGTWSSVPQPNVSMELRLLPDRLFILDVDTDVQMRQKCFTGYWEAKDAEIVLAIDRDDSWSNETHRLTVVGVDPGELRERVGDPPSVTVIWARATGP